jgi:hypothetical protein
MKSSLPFTLVFLVVSFSVGRAEVWHIDGNAREGGDGRSWSTAWSGFTAVTWKAIRPGDVIEISGGRKAEGLRYPEPLVLAASGESNAPITIRLGRAPGHRGPVTLPGLDIGRHKWITVDGSLSADFVAPTNILQLRSITNNIGLYCSSTNGPAIYMTAPTGVRLLWVGVPQARRGSQRRAHGIYANMVRRGPTDLNEIRYCWIKDTDDDGIAWIGNDPATHFGHQEIAFSIIERVGDDGLEANHGFNVHDNIIGPSLFLNGHPDGIQSVGSYWKIYNNEFHDFFNSWLRLQATQTNHHDVWVYNNLFLSGRHGESKVNIYNTGIEVVQYADGLGELPAMTWERILICNNTFYGARGLVGGVMVWAKRDERTKAAFVHNVFVTNCLVVNNLAFDCGRGASASWQPVKAGPPWGRAVHYATEECLQWDFNTMSGLAAPEPSRIGYFGRMHANGEMMGRTSPWKNNSSGRVRFRDPKVGDFELAPEDRAARGTGTNLQQWFSYDLLNRPRSGAWDRGALQHQP